MILIYKVLNFIINIFIIFYYIKKNKKKKSKKIK